MREGTATSYLRRASEPRWVAAQNPANATNEKRQYWTIGFSAALELGPNDPEATENVSRLLRGVSVKCS